MAIKSEKREGHFAAIWLRVEEAQQATSGAISGRLSLSLCPESSPGLEQFTSHTVEAMRAPLEMLAIPYRIFIRALAIALTLESEREAATIIIVVVQIIIRPRANMSGEKFVLLAKL